jgi:hypothetical protein
MTTSTMRIIWDRVAFDAGRYQCRITQDEDKGARLTVELMTHGPLGNILIHTEPITLTIDKSGGPVQDVDKWKSICDNIIDHPKHRSSVAGLSAWNLQ